nr:RNA-directed DNA polymerase, eukaryota [Tanacetum cinerariifolium]
MKVIINERHKVIYQGIVYWIYVKEFDAWFPNFQEDDQDDLSSDGESQEGDVANKADNNESDVDRVSDPTFMHENDTAHKDVNICKKGEDYLRTFIDRWEGDAVIMGDFNEGFNSFVKTTWKSLNIVKPNGLIQLKKKLQALKIAIKAWSKEANKRSNYRKINIQQNLSEVDKLIDQGKSNDEILIKRITLLNDLEELNNRNAMEISQKAKIQWSIEGDENSKYFHDDVVFIGEWNNNNIQTLLSVLRCFYLASGLKINLHKSKLMEIGVSSNVVAAAASLIGCSILTTPFNYLGVKVSRNMSRITSWYDVISKVSSRLSKWKHKLLSIGSRLSLLKSVLTSILLYHMYLFKVPIGVLNHLESIRRNFFYGVDGSDRKLAWIGWNMVLTSKKNGGLGVSSFFAHNHALLFKWVWKFLTDGEVALKVLYKRLYALEICKSISVAEKMSHPSLSHSFRRIPRGGVEQENYGLLCSKVVDLVLPNISDRWCWSLVGSQEFSVKSSRILIDNTILPKAEVPTR